MQSFCDHISDVAKDRPGQTCAYVYISNFYALPSYMFSMPCNQDRKTLMKQLNTLLKQSAVQMFKLCPGNYLNLAMPA